MCVSGQGKAHGHLGPLKSVYVLEVFRTLSFGYSKSPSNLLEFLERDMDLEEELKKFQRDEVVEV
jgi:hypothetical protein